MLAPQSDCSPEVLFLFSPLLPFLFDIIAQSPDHKSEHFLVKCVEYVDGHNSVNLHVKPFPNQASTGIDKQTEQVMQLLSLPKQLLF